MSSRSSRDLPREAESSKDPVADPKRAQRVEGAHQSVDLTTNLRSPRGLIAFSCSGQFVDVISASVKQKIPNQLKERIRSVTSKRPRTVLDHILKHGFITTEQLRNKYGYDHPPRAARDVREQGIQLETFKVTSTSGRKIAAYRLDLKAEVHSGKSGRKQFPKKLKRVLLELGGPKCAVCGGQFDPTYLQVDHKVPYEVAGESGGDTPEVFMLLCASCNRTKSWACEHCRNWIEIKKAEICSHCYWASPDNYKHIAMVNIRRADISWIGEDVKLFDRLRDAAEKSGQSIQVWMKKVIRELVK